MQTRAEDGKMISNEYCIQCYNELGELKEMHTVDHIKRIEDGGSSTDFRNLQSLCKRHHAIKSANERNGSRKY
jgi:5-methylcytosine-specific restriction endonuclease McrA